MKSLTRRLLKWTALVLKKRPWFKKVALKLLNKLPRLKRTVLRGLVAETMRPKRSLLDARGKRILTSLAFQASPSHQRKETQ